LRPVRQCRDRIERRTEAREIERQLTAHDQLFKLVGDKLVLRGIVANGKRDLEEENVRNADTDESRSRVRRRLIVTRA
jgi:hypothetical protein